MAREAEKESVLYERQRDTSPAQLPGGGNCAGWVEKDGAGSAVGESEQFATSMQLGAQSWDFGVNLTNNLAPPHTPGGRISNWLQNAQAGLNTPAQSPSLPGSPWSTRHPPGYGQKWEYEPTHECTPHSRSDATAQLGVGSPQWRNVSQADREETTRRIFEDQRARLRGAQPQGVISRKDDLMASCDAVMSPHRCTAAFAQQQQAFGQQQFGVTTPNRSQCGMRFGTSDARSLDTCQSLHQARGVGALAIIEGAMVAISSGQSPMSAVSEEQAQAVEWHSPDRVGALTPTAIF